MARRTDLTGSRIGRLSVLTPTDMRVSNRVVWRCQCDCGNITYVTTSHLTSGNTTSCGCARIGVNADDLSGQRYGRLVALSPTRKHLGNSVMWRCRCDCGRVADVAAISLRKGHTKSCGCLASEVHAKTINAAQKERAGYYVDNTDVLQLAQPPRSNNTSGIVGVTWDKSVKLWKAYITFKGKRYYLIASNDISVCIAARKEAEQLIHGEFLDWYYEQERNPKL